jgi:hypothetical protein
MTAPMPMPALALVVRPDGDDWREGVDDGGCDRDVARRVDVVLLLLEDDEVVGTADGGWDVNLEDVDDKGRNVAVDRPPDDVKVVVTSDAAIAFSDATIASAWLRKLFEGLSLEVEVGLEVGMGSLALLILVSAYFS